MWVQFYFDFGPKIVTISKNENVSGIISVSGGIVRCFWTRGNLFTCGNNDDGQLGLGDKKLRTTPHKVKAVPPIYLLSTCNTSYNCFQVADCERRSCLEQLLLVDLDFCKIKFENKEIALVTLQSDI